MSFKLQHIPSESRFGHHLDVQVLEQFYPRQVVSELLTACHAWEQRERKLSQLLIVYYVIALSLFRHLNITAVFAHLSRGLRWLWPDEPHLERGRDYTSSFQYAIIPPMQNDTIAAI